MLAGLPAGAAVTGAWCRRALAEVASRDIYGTAKVPTTPLPAQPYCSPISSAGLPCQECNTAHSQVMRRCLHAGYGAGGAKPTGSAQGNTMHSKPAVHPGWFQHSPAAAHHPALRPQLHCPHIAGSRRCGTGRTAHQTLAWWTRLQLNERRAGGGATGGHGMGGWGVRS